MTIATNINRTGYMNTFPIDQTRNLPVVPSLSIADNVHIWGVSLGQPALVEGKQNATIPLTRGDA